MAQRADVSVSYRDSIFYSETEGRMVLRYFWSTVRFPSPIERQMAGNSVAESGLYDASQAAKLVCM